ncbi:hypothetical protein FQR65_LT20821 [Abscondita terminalis]|nr:hypothetical protein FQR65_LT20821 [Abscondita terminalis]
MLAGRSGEIGLREKEGMQQYIERPVAKNRHDSSSHPMCRTLSIEMPRLPLGRLGLGCSQFLGPHLAQSLILHPEQSEYYSRKPFRNGTSLLQFFNEMSKAQRSLFNGPPPVHTALWDTFQRRVSLHESRQCANLTSAGARAVSRRWIPDFDCLPAGLPALIVKKFRGDLYGGLNETYFYPAQAPVRTTTPRARETIYEGRFFR